MTLFGGLSSKTRETLVYDANLSGHNKKNFFHFFQFFDGLSGNKLDPVNS